MLLLLLLRCFRSHRSCRQISASARFSDASILLESFCRGFRVAVAVAVVVAVVVVVAVAVATGLSTQAGGVVDCSLCCDC